MSAPTPPRPSVQTRRSVSDGSHQPPPHQQQPLPPAGTGGTTAGRGLPRPAPMTASPQCRAVSESAAIGAAGGGGGGGGPALALPPLHPSTPGGGHAQQPTAPQSHPPQHQQHQHRPPSPQQSLREVLAAGAAAASSPSHRTTPSADSALHTIDSQIVNQRLSVQNEEVRSLHGLDFHDDDSSMGSVVFNYQPGSTPPGEYDLPNRILSDVRRGRLDTGEESMSSLMAGGSGHGGHPNGAGGGQQQPQQQQQNGTGKPHRWGSEVGINQTTSIDQGEEEEDGGDDDDDGGRRGARGGGYDSYFDAHQPAPPPEELTASGSRVLPYHERMRKARKQERQQQQQQPYQQQYPPGLGGSKPPLSPTKPPTDLRKTVRTTNASGADGYAPGAAEQMRMPGLNGAGTGSGGSPDDRPPLHSGKRTGGWFRGLFGKKSHGTIDEEEAARRYHDKNQAFLRRTERHRAMVRSGNVDFVPGGGGGGGAGGIGAGVGVGMDWSGHARNRTHSATLDSIASLSSEEEETTTDDEEGGAAGGRTAAASGGGGDRGGPRGWDGKGGAGARSSAAQGEGRGGTGQVPSRTPPSAMGAGRGRATGGSGRGDDGGGGETRPLLSPSTADMYERRIRELEAENARLLRIRRLEDEMASIERRKKMERTVKGQGAEDSQGIAMSDTSYRRLANELRIAKAEAEIARKEAEYAREAAMSKRRSTYWRDRFRRRVQRKMSRLCKSTEAFSSSLLTFFSNLPLTVSAMAMSYVTLGVVWFKFYEENDVSCVPTHFHSPGCSFPEFPGCFECDKDNYLYRLALAFHYICSTFSGLLVSAVLVKLFLAGRVVLDDLANPTSSAPYGLLFMSSVCIFAGHGWVGKVIVLSNCCLHLALTLWFIYTIRAFNVLPDPSWYPNMVGIGYPAVKMWLYHPYAGFFLMTISFVCMVVVLPISVFRVLLNRKISAPVCWIQMSAPSIVLYTLTLMAQPISNEQEFLLDTNRFQNLHRQLYLPLMHFMFLLCLVGVFSSVFGLYTRWSVIRKKEFSPAHAAFCFPTLSHANAIQAYRGAINSFSTMPPGSPYKIFIYSYWLVFLVAGTIVLFVLSVKFFSRLPKWTQIEVEGPETEPPAPNQTLIHEVVDMGERMMNQTFVSPAVLQANETGALVRRKRGTEDMRGQFVRTRNLTALGFEPIMRWGELQEEIEILLEWAAKNPPRRRKGWLSVPGIDFGGDFGRGNMGVYDDRGSSTSQRRRTQSDDVNRLSVQRAQGSSADRTHGRNDSDHMYMWG